MKRWKSLTAALCAAVLLCGFSAVPAFAYADGGEGENYGDPTMTEETTAPEPEPTIEPGEGFSEEGNLVTRDLLYDEHTNKQFITVQTAGGNTFYIVIDYDKPVDEEYGLPGLRCQYDRVRGRGAGTRGNGGNRGTRPGGGRAGNGRQYGDASAGAGRGGDRRRGWLVL